MYKLCSAIYTKHIDKYFCIVTSERPTPSAKAPQALKQKSEIYKCLQNSLILTGLSQLGVMRVVTTMLLHWVLESGQCTSMSSSATPVRVWSLTFHVEFSCKLLVPLASLWRLHHPVALFRSAVLPLFIFSFKFFVIAALPIKSIVFLPWLRS